MNNSTDALVWAIRAKGTSASAFKVLVKLAAHVGNEDGNFDVWPSHRTLAREAEISVATVRRTLDELVEAGFIKIIPTYRDNGGQSSNVYRLMVRTTHFMPDGKVEIDAKIRSSHDVRQRSGGDDYVRAGSHAQNEHPIEPIQEGTIPEGSPPLSPQGGQQLALLSTEPAIDMIEAFEIEWEKLVEDVPAFQSIRGGKLNDRRRAAFKRVFKGSSQEIETTLRDVFAKMRTGPHLRGENDRGWKADVDWILNSANVDKVVGGRYERSSNSMAVRGGSAISSTQRALERVRARREQRGDGAGGASR